MGRYQAEKGEYVLALVHTMYTPGLHFRMDRCKNWSKKSRLHCPRNCKRKCKVSSSCFYYQL